MRVEGSALEAVVDAQHAAYNARTLDDYCALFAPDVRTFDLESGQALVEGIEALRAHYARRFSDAPDLRCTVLERRVMAGYVIDHERVFGLAPEPVEVVAIYEVRAGRIRSIRFLSPIND
jgi:hypothetical protein